MPSRCIFAGLELNQHTSRLSCLLCRCKICSSSTFCLGGRRPAMIPLQVCRQGRRPSRRHWTQQQPPARLPRSGWQRTRGRMQKRRQLLRPPETRWGSPARGASSFHVQDLATTGAYNTMSITFCQACRSHSSKRSWWGSGGICCGRGITMRPSAASSPSPKGRQIPVHWIRANIPHACMRHSSTQACVQTSCSPASIVFRTLTSCNHRQTYATEEAVQRLEVGTSQGR